jgi:hypothetical protein
MRAGHAEEAAPPASTQHLGSDTAGVAAQLEQEVQLLLHKPTRERRNVFYAVMFGAHVLVLYASVLTADVAPAGEGLLAPDGATAARGAWMVAAFMAWAFGLMWAAMMYSMSQTAAVGRVLVFSHHAAVGLFLLHALILLVYGVLSAALLLAAVAAADALWMRRTATERLRFVVEELSLVAAGVSLHRELVATVVGLSVAQLAFTLLWAAAAGRALLMAPGSATAVIVLLLFSLRWCAGVLKHAVTYVTAGVFTSWLAANARVNGHSRLLSLRAGALEGDLPGEAEADDADSASEVSGNSPSAARAGAGAATASSERGGAGAAPDMSDIGLADFADVTAAPMGRRPGAKERADGGGAATGAGAAAVALDVGPARGGDWEYKGDPSSAPAAAPAPSRPTTGTERAPEAPASTPHADTSALTFLRYALTYSLGSLAAGALLGFGAPLAWATLRGLRRVARAATARHPRVAAAAAAGARAATAYIRVSSKYTWVLVASKGRGWFPAARRTWSMFTSRGVEAVLEDDCTDRLLLFGCYVGGGVLSLMLGTTAHTGGTGSWLLTVIVTFWLGFIGAGLPLTVLEAAVSTLFVSFCQVPEVLSVLHPLVHARFLRLAELRQLERSHPAYERVRSYDDD